MRAGPVFFLLVFAASLAFSSGAESEQPVADCDCACDDGEWPSCQFDGLDALSPCNLDEMGLIARQNQLRLAKDANCTGPFPAAYPNCSKSIEWLVKNWNIVGHSLTYRNGGVDGSRCSAQAYIATEDQQRPACPLLPSQCQGPYGKHFPDCEGTIVWMEQNWKIVAWTDTYVKGGVDGSRCSIQKFIASEDPINPKCPNPMDLKGSMSKAEAKAAKSTATSDDPASCKGPYDGFPDCEGTIQWMAENWNKVAWTQTYIDGGVDGSRCSIQRFINSEKPDAPKESSS